MITETKNKKSTIRICDGFNLFANCTPIGEAIKLPIATGSANENTIKEPDPEVATLDIEL